MTSTMTIAAPGELIQEHGISLILVGFPKCGTTAFADWLAQSPQIDVSTPKETFLLCPEFADNLERSGFRDTDFETCFSRPLTSDVMRMEATTLNAYSPSLLASVRTNDQLRCVVLTRDPVHTTLSWHNQVINAGFQSSNDFEESWNYGRSLDAATGQDFLRQYQTIASYGRWCSEWIDAVGHERCLLLKAEDLRDSPMAVKARLETFLGRTIDLPSSGPPERNKFAEPRSKFLYDAIRGSRLLQGFRSVEKYFHGLASLRRTIRDKIVLKQRKKEIRADVEAMLRSAFADDQVTLATIAAKNAAMWN